MSEHLAAASNYAAPLQIRPSVLLACEVMFPFFKSPCSLCCFEYGYNQGHVTTPHPPQPFLSNSRSPSASSTPFELPDSRGFVSFMPGFCRLYFSTFSSVRSFKSHLREAVGFPSAAAAASRSATFQTNA